MVHGLLLISNFNIVPTLSQSSSTSIISPEPQTTWQGRIGIITPVLYIRKLRSRLSDMAKPYALFRSESSTWTWSPRQGSILQAQRPHVWLESEGRRWQQEHPGCLSLLDDSLHPEARKRGREKPRAGQGPEFLLHGLTWILSQRSTEESGAGDRREEAGGNHQAGAPSSGTPQLADTLASCSPSSAPHFGSHLLRDQRAQEGLRGHQGTPESQALHFNPK